jgi:hypothetical protein
MEDITEKYRETNDDKDLDTSHIADHEMRFLLNRTLWWLKNKGFLDCNYKTELRVDVNNKDGKLLTFGTADLVAFPDNEFAVIDYKTHRTELDKITATCQINCYRVGVSQRFNLSMGTGYLYLPFLDLEYQADTDISEARDEIEQIVSFSQQPDSPIKAGPWCKYCKAKVTCPETKKALAKVSDQLVVPEDAATKAEKKRAFETQLKEYAANGNISKVAEIGEMLSIVEPAIDAWRNVAKELIENGHGADFPNWEIKERQGNRQAEVMEVWQKVQSIIPDDQFAQCASVKWKELTQHFVENVQAEALRRGQKLPVNKAKKMLDDLLGPVVSRKPRKELWRVK